MTACGQVSSPGQGGGLQTGPSTTQTSGEGAGSGGNPSLGMTSISKTQQTNTLQKAMALSTLDCPPSSAAHEITLRDGRVWITQAYLILDEIEFHLQGDATEGISDGPFAIDLTGMDPLVPENIDHNIPPGRYVRTKFRFKQIDNTNLPRNLGDDLEAFEEMFLGGGAQPSILVKGSMKKDGRDNNCHSFMLITDLDWRLTIQFLPEKTVDPSKQDIVFLADLPAAFQTSGAAISDLIDEIGRNVQLGGGFLDGRLIEGTPGAKAVAEKIPEHFQVFTQAAGTFKGDPAVAANAEPVSVPGPPEFEKTVFPEL